jgi:hypothetical protein
MPDEVAAQRGLRSAADRRARVRLESAVGLLRDLAVTGAGGLEVAREPRAPAVAVAEQLGDPELAARVSGAYDVPAIWPRSDDTEQAAGIVAAAERALAVLASGSVWIATFYPNPRRWSRRPARYRRGWLVPGRTAAAGPGGDRDRAVRDHLGE